MDAHSTAAGNVLMQSRGDMQRFRAFQPNIPVNPAQVGKIQQPLGFAGGHLGVVPVVRHHNQHIVPAVKTGRFAQVHHKRQVAAVIGMSCFSRRIRRVIR